MPASAEDTLWTLEEHHLQESHTRNRDSRILSLLSCLERERDKHRQFSV